MLGLRGVSVAFGQIAAVSSVELEVGPAERLAILGPSGSGKSTLLRAVAGLEPLSAGSVEWDGVDLATVPAHRRGFGLMFQDYLLFPHRNVAQNVGFGLRMRAMASVDIERRVTEVLELVGLGGYGTRAVTELSGGEQQRVALARALAPTPRLLMLDEPLGALDRSLRTRLLDDLSQLFELLRLPIIYVTHDQEEALAIGERVAVMRAGRVETVLPPAELWHSPPSEFVARFLGFENICTAEVGADHVAATPWGAINTPPGIGPGTHRLLLLPDAITLNADGTLRGRVVARTFRGDHTNLRIEISDRDAPALEVQTREPEAPGIGAIVGLNVALGGIVVLP
jgi:thiamine transport system ATP-binding protein